jgi:hypothetical protein
MEREYLFRSKTITEQEVRKIVQRAGYEPSNATCRPLPGHGGWSVASAVAMVLPSLRNAARTLGIRVDITSSALSEPARWTGAGSAGYEIFIPMDDEAERML